jgi:hypothetical protein
MANVDAEGVVDFELRESRWLVGAATRSDGTNTDLSPEQRTNGARFAATVCLRQDAQLVLSAKCSASRRYYHAEFDFWPCFLHER